MATDNDQSPRAGDGKTLGIPYTRSAFKNGSPWVTFNIRSEHADAAELALGGSPIVPTGFVLVPIEPTPQMLAAYWDEALEVCMLDHFASATRANCILAKAYAAMLAAAPAVSAPAAKLEDLEQYRLQMAGISTAALGYWKESDGILPDYDTLALRDVAKLYAKYDALYKARTEWVEVTERLPEDRSEVLFFSGDLRNPASMLLGMYIDGEFCCAGYTMVNVTHWAKKPAQPDIEPPEVA